MKKTSLILILATTGVWRLSAFSATVDEIISDPEKYQNRRMAITGIARVPGYFYLFSTAAPAAQLDLSKALLIRQNNTREISFRPLDRQWVRVTGTITSRPVKGWDAGTGLLLEKAEILNNRYPPQIKDPTIVAVFRNDTGKTVRLQLVTPSKTLDEEQWFNVRSHQVEETMIDQGGEVIVGNPTKSSVAELKGFARCPIQLSALPPDYQYTPLSSPKRRIYYKITNTAIQQVPSSEGAEWKILKSEITGTGSAK